MELLSIKKLNISIDDENKIIDGELTIYSGDVVLLTGPNGCGKSTVIKIILGDIFDYEGLKYSAKQMLYLGSTNLLGAESEREFFRKDICYVSQDDTFESPDIMDCFMMSLHYSNIENKKKHIFQYVCEFAIGECFGFDSGKRKYDRKVKALMREYNLSEETISDNEYLALRFLTMKTTSMSGGQKKLANIFVNLIRYSFCKLIILDEPLNNLDYSNIRAFANALTKIHIIKPEVGILVVTHCRSIPIVNKVVEIDKDSKKMVIGKEYHCNSCFGAISETGLYI